MDGKSEDGGCFLFKMAIDELLVLAIGLPTLIKLKKLE